MSSISAVLHMTLYVADVELHNHNVVMYKQKLLSYYLAILLIAKAYEK